MFWDLDGAPFSSRLLHGAKRNKKFPVTATLQDRNPVDAIIAVKRYMRAHGLCPADAAFDVHVFHSPVGCTVKFRLSVAERDQIAREASLHDVLSSGPDATCDAAHKVLVGALTEPTEVKTVFVLVAPKFSAAAAERAAAAALPLHFFNSSDFPDLKDKSVPWDDVLAPVPFRAEDGTPHASREQLDNYVERVLTLTQLPRAESRDALRQGICSLFPGTYTVRMYLSSDFLSAQCLFETKEQCNVALVPTYHGLADTSTAQALRAIKPVGMRSTCLTTAQLTALAKDDDLEDMHLAPPPSPRKGVSYSAVLGPSSRTTPEPSSAGPTPTTPAPAAAAAAAAPAAAPVPAAAAPAAAPVPAAAAPAAVPKTAAPTAVAPTPATSVSVPAAASAKPAAASPAKSFAPSVTVIDHRNKGSAPRATSAKGGKRA